MHFDAALNLVWVSLGLAALASTVHAGSGQNSSENRPSAWLHVVGVALIVAALFPYISATDDVLRIDDLNTQHSHRNSGKQSPTNNLLRLYETMDAPLVCQPREVAFTSFFVGLVYTPTVRTLDRVAPFRAGRSPPARLAA